MRSIRLGFALLQLLPTLALADGLRPLSESLSQEQSPSMLVYVSKRCAALYAASASRLASSGRSDVSDIMKEQNAVTGRFLLLSVNIAKQSGLNESQERITDDAADMGAMYGKAMQESYLATGNAISEAIKADFALCKSILEQ